MAHKARVLGEEVNDFFDGLHKHFWNIDAEVGWGCKNYWDDVMLVQYLLNSAEGAKLVVDGLFGKKTYKAIRAFQKSCGTSLVDGKLDVTDGNKAEMSNSSGTKWTYLTILRLNAAYHFHHNVFYEDLRMDGNLPSELCQIFSSWKNE